ncbi:hypothetical protein ABPG72_013473 [Tetrahymena utriculariae]
MNQFGYGNKLKEQNSENQIDHFQNISCNQNNKSRDDTSSSKQMKNSNPQTPIKLHRNENASFSEESNDTQKQSFFDQIYQKFNPQQQNQFLQGSEKLKNSQESLKNENAQQMVNNQVNKQIAIQKQQRNQVELPKRIQESDLQQMKQLIYQYQQSTSQLSNQSQVNDHINKANTFLNLMQQNEKQYIDNINILRLNIQTQQNQIDKQNSSLQNYESSYSKLQTNYAKLKNDLECKQSEIEENEKRYQESNSYQSQSIDALNKENVELNNQNNNLRQYQSLFEQSQQKLEKLNKTLVEKSTQIETLSQKCQELQNNLENVTQLQIQDKQQIEKLNKTVVEKSTQIQTQIQKCQELQNNLENVTQLQIQDKQQIEKLKEDQKIQNEKKQRDFQESIIKLENQIVDLKAEVNKLVNQNNYLNQYESMYQEQLKENQKLQEGLQEQQKQTEQNDQQIKQLKSLLEEAQQQSIKNKREYEQSVQDQKVQNEEYIRTFQLIKNGLEEKIYLKQKEINELTNKNNELTKYVDLYKHSQDNIQQLQQALNTTSDQLEQQKKQTIKMQNELENTTVKMANEIKEIQNKLQQKIDSQNIQTIEMNKLNNDLIKYKGLYNQSEQNYQQSQHTLIHKNKEIEQLKQQNIQLQKDLDDNSQKQQETVKEIIQQLSCSQIKGNNIDAQVQQVLTQLNPQIQIEPNQIQFAKALSIIEKNKPSEQEKINLQTKNNELVQKYQTDQLNNAQQATTANVNNKASLDSIKCLLVLQNMYKEDGVTTFITDQPISQLQKEESYQQQQSFIQIGLHDKASYFQMKFDKQAALYNELMQTKTKNNLNDFLKKFKSIIGLRINSYNPQQEVIIMNVGFVQAPQIDFQVNSNQYTNKQLKKAITFRDIGVSVSEQSLLDFAKLSVDMFNPKYNMEWGDNYKGKSEPRGQLKFYNQTNPVYHIYNFPVGYKGYALDVSKYGNDLSWISSNGDSKTWIVLFHGTNENALSGIMQNNLLPGQRNAYGGKLCRITNTNIKQGSNANVYLTDSIQEAERFAKQTSIYNQKKFQIIYQCRVNPSGVKSPNDNHLYYTVEDNLNIRPYRILLKEC